MVEKKKSSTQTCSKIFGDRDLGSIKRILWPIIVSITWKKMFDEFFRKYASESNERFRPFDIGTDYKLYVDGRTRFDGVPGELLIRPNLGEFSRIFPS